MKETIISCTIICMTAIANARTWTDTNGRSVEAEIVKLNPDQTVILKTNRGRVVTVPFNTFVEMDIQYLKTRLAVPHDLHPVPWQKMNELFGIKIWNDSSLWDDPTAEVSKRLNMKKESKTDFMENHRAYPSGEKYILDEPAYATALYGGIKNTESLSIFFLNKGDMPIQDWRKITQKETKEMARQVKESGVRVYNTLIPVLGEPDLDSLGSGYLREKVWRWDWNDHAIMLSVQGDNYAALRISPISWADHGGRVEKTSDDKFRERIASCVEHRNNGDVIIRNIPMVDQGPKGYCFPATMERYLRYLEIPADMYLLAINAYSNGRGGNSVFNRMIDSTQKLIAQNGRKIRKISPTLSPAGIAEYIDEGLPILWWFKSTPAFQFAANACTAKRNGETSKTRANSGQAGSEKIFGHICLIIGYNKQTNEIAVSDSWGASYAERWVPADKAQEVCLENMIIIRW